jgi:uncharacterized membrane protein YfcA
MVETYFLFFIVSIVAGVINAVAGGGGLIRFSITSTRSGWTLPPSLRRTAIGGLVGGYIGGIVSHRANRTVVRSIVVGIGLAVSAHYFWKLYGQAVIHVGGD